MRQWFLSWVSRLLGLGEALVSAKRRQLRSAPLLFMEPLEDRTAPSTWVVRDINPAGNSSPRLLTNVNGTLFFVANNGTAGYELWRSDGTATGTQMVLDIRPGILSSIPTHLTGVMTNVNGTLFFVANNGAAGYELWRSDGTPAGTQLVADIRSGSASSSPRYLTNVNGTLFFVANNGAAGYELWRSDGTSTGTQLVLDIRTGSASSSPRYLTNVNGTLFFVANDGSTGLELWRSYGSPGDTWLVKDIHPGSGSSSPAFVTGVSGTLFFAAHDNGTVGRELWAVDDRDDLAPTIVSVTPPANGTYVAGQNLNFVVQFSETVVVTGTPRLQLTIGGTTRYATYVSGTGTATLLFRYTVLSGDSDMDGIAVGSPVDLNGGTIRDSAGNDAVLTFPPPDTSGVLVDAVAPTVVSVTPPANGTYVAGQNLDFVVQFSEAVVVTGTPRLQLTVGSTPRFATYVSGSGTATLTFRYTVAVGDLDTDGIVVSSPVDLNGGTIRDNAGNDAGLSFTPPDTSGVLVDAVAPTIVSVTPPANGTYRAGQALDVLVEFSEPVTVGTSGSAKPYIRLRIGSVIRQALFFDQPNPTTLRFRYVVQTGDLDTNGIEILSPVMRPSGTYIRDAAGNNATTTFTNPSTPNVKVDAVAPTIVQVTPPANGHYVTGQVLDILVKFSEPVTVGTSGSAKPYIRLRIGSVIRNAEFHSKPNAVTLRFRYVVQTGDLDTNGIEILSPVMRPSGTFIRDLAGNDALVTFVPPSTTGVTVN
jgi:ELWxxDGT repeat protein